MPGDVYPFVSVSQINKFRECQRKWAWQYLAGIKTPQHPNAALGDEVEKEQLTPYLLEGREFDYTRKSGYIANAFRPYLPPPKTPGIQLQRPINIPSPTFVDDKHIGMSFNGFIDIFAEDSKLFPDIPGGVPGVGDFKTKKNLKYALTEKTISTDPQAMLYAMDTLFVTRAKAVDLVWMNSVTEGDRPNKANRVHLRVVPDQVAEQFEHINATALAIFDRRKQALGGLTVEDLPPNPDQCEAFGGCPYRPNCNLSPSQVVHSYVNKSIERPTQTRGAVVEGGEQNMSTSDALAALAKRKQQMLGGTSAPVAPPPPPPPPPAPAAFVPNPETEAGWAEEHARRQAAKAAFAGEQLPEWATAAVDPMAAKFPPRGPAPLGINPPEKDLPPAPPVGSTVAAAPAPAAEAAPAKRTRGPNKPKAAPDAETEAQLIAREVQAGQTVRVVWGVEHFTPVPYNGFDVGPFEAIGAVLPGETLTQASSRIYDELTAFAQIQRAAKTKAFQEALGALLK